MTHEEQIKWMTDQITKLEGQYKAAMDTTAMLMSKMSPSRNEVLEEVAKEIEKMTVFGKDTIGSFTVVIRNLKTKE
jgi:predicted transcriptional regulator